MAELWGQYALHNYVACCVCSVKVTSCWSDQQATGGEQSVALLRRYFMDDVGFEVGLIWCPCLYCRRALQARVLVWAKTEGMRKLKSRFGVQVGQVLAPCGEEFEG